MNSLFSRQPNGDHLDTLLCRLVDGLLTPAEQAELEQLLQHDPDARERYRLYLAAHVELAAHPLEIPARREVPAWRRTGMFAVPALAAAAAVALFVGFALWPDHQDDSSQSNLALASQAEAPVLAVVSRADDSRWQSALPLATGAQLRAGGYQLAAGVLGLNMAGGQQLTIRAPARFDLLSETEMLLHQGDAALRMEADGPAFIIRVPGGAVVDLGTEISVKVGPDGPADVRVFEGFASVSLLDEANRTRTQRLLRAGESARIGDDLESSQTAEDAFLRSLPNSHTDRSPAGPAYAAVVARSQPLAWWRFDHMANPRVVSPQAGGLPLLLIGSPQVIGTEGSRFLMTDTTDALGFAVPPSSIPGLDTAAGFSVECLIHPLCEAHGTALAIDQPDLPPSSTPPPASHIVHPPQRLVIERMGRRGSLIGHIHPDYALRAMMRSPAGYEGGTNTYSSESHLMHRWIHVAFTHDGQRLRLYLDGRLSDEAEAKLAFQNAALRPIIGRMQPMAAGETRQWHGGIDEVALYGRVLTPEEISTHAAALQH